MIYLQYNNEDFNWNGLPLSQSYDDVIEHELNGVYKLTFKIPINETEQHKLIERNSLLKATEHYRDRGYNIFRVKYIDKEEDYVQYTAYQLIFDLSKKYVNPFSIVDLYPIEALNQWKNNFVNSLISPIYTWSNITDKRVTYYSQKKDNQKERLALNVLFEMANELQYDLDFHERTVSLGKVGRETQYIYTANKNITSYSQEENYDEVVTRITATSTFKPEFDKEKLKQQHQAELEELKKKHRDSNEKIALAKRQERMESEIKETIRKEKFKQLNYEKQKAKLNKTMRVRSFKTADQITAEITNKYEMQKRKKDAQNEISKRHLEIQKNEIKKLKEKQKDEYEKFKEEVVISVTVDSPFVDDYPEIYEQRIENNDIKSVDELTAYVESLYSIHNVDKPKITFKVGLETLKHEEVNLGDSVIVRYIKHDIDQRKRVISTKYSPMSKEYIEITFGDKSDNYAVQNNNVSYANAQSVANDFNNETHSYFKMLIQKEKENFNHYFEDETNIIKEIIKDNKLKAEANVNLLDSKFTDEFNKEHDNFLNQLNGVKRELSLNFQNDLSNSTNPLNVKIVNLTVEANNRYRELDSKITNNHLDSTNKVDELKRNMLTELTRNKNELSLAFQTKLYSVNESINSKALDTVYSNLVNIRNRMITPKSISADKLVVDSSLIDKLFTDNLLSNKIASDYIVGRVIETKSLNTINANIYSIKSKILSTRSINSDMLDVNQAMINKLLVNDLLVNSLTSNDIFTEKIKSKALEAVNADIGNLRSKIITTNSIESDSINVDYALVDKLINHYAFIDTLTSKRAFIDSIKAIDIDATRITSGVLRSTSGSMRWDLDGNSLDYYDGAETNYYGSSRIIFHTTNNSIYQSNNGTCAFLNFSRTIGTQYPAIAIGTSSNLDDDSNTGSFSGFRAHTAKAIDGGRSEVDIIADKVIFDSHGGDVNTGGWTLENYRKGGNEYRKFYGNNARNYKYELGQDDYRFNSVWTRGLNEHIKVVSYSDGYAGIISRNEKHGIQIGNYDVRILYNNRWTSFRDILRKLNYNV